MKESLPLNQTKPAYQSEAFWIYLILAGIVALVTISMQNQTMKESWFQGLKHPDWQLSSGFLTIIWVVAYFILAWASFLGYRSAKTGREAHLITIAFVLVLALNLFWSILFQQEDLTSTLWIGLLLLISTIWLLVMVFRINRTAGALLLLYLLWLIVILIYNWQLRQLN